MSRRLTDDEGPTGPVLHPQVVAESLAAAARPDSARPQGSGRRMRRLGMTVAVIIQIALLVAMVLVPAGTFAGKPSSDPAASTTQEEAGKGKSEEAKAKKGSTETQTAPTEESKPGKGAEKKSDPTTKGNGGSNDKSNKPDKGTQGQSNKAEAAAAETLVAAAGEPTITSDKADYAPGEMVTLTGASWQGDEPSGVQITVNDDAGKTWSYGNIADVANDGTIREKFKLPDSFAAVYNVTATGLDTDRVATTSFTDGFAVVDFKQCANEDPTLGTCHWITSIVQSSNSNYAEGMDNPQRLLFTGIEDTTADEHTLTFSHEATKGGVHAYDWLTSYDQAQADSAAAGIPLTLNECGEEIGPPANLDDICDALRAGAFFIDVPVPDDAFVSADGSTQTRINAYEALRGNRTIRIWANAAISDGALTLAHTVANGGDTGDSSINYELSWTSAATEILVEMAGHIAMANTAAGWGAGNGASSISGGPYHFSLKSFDGDASGAQDNQIKGADLIEPASITIIKDTVPNSGQDFAYTTTGTGLAPFSLDDDADGTLSNTQAFTGIISFGNKTVTETVPVAGYVLSDIVCSGDSNLLIGADADFDPGDATVTIDLDEGENVSCTFTNTLLGSLTIIKDVNPEPDATDFAFTGTGAGVSDFSLDDDADGTLSDTKTFSNLANGVLHTVTETTLPAYSLSNIACTGATTSTVVIGAAGGFDAGDTFVDVTLADGESVTCTFTNTLLGSLTIIKDVNPEPDATDFAFTGTGAGVSDFSLDDDADGTLSDTKTFSNLANGVLHTVTETTLPAYSLSNIACTGATTSTVVIGAAGGFDAGDTFVDVTLADGESVTCTFTNTLLGSLTIIKDVNPEPDATDFAFTGTGAGVSDFSLDDDADGTLSDTKTFSNLANGVLHTVTETTLPAYSLSNIACTGATTSTVVIGAAGGFDAGDTFVDVTLADGESVTCTFTNTLLGSLTIIKDVNPEPDATDFAFTGTGAGVSDFSLDDDADGTLSDTKTFSNLANGVLHTVTETTLPAYSLSNIACTGATTSTVVIGAAGGFDAGDTFVDVTLADGESVTCTFTNTLLGSLTIIKDVNPEPDATDFAFTGTGAGVSDFSLDDDADGTLSDTKTFSNLANGVLHTVTETTLPAYSLSNIACTGATTSTVVIGAAGGFDAGDTFVDVTLADGESVTCTFTNTLLGSLTIIKDVNPEPDATDFAFTGTGAGVSDFSLDDDADGTLSDTKTFSNLANGVLHTVTETTLPAYSLSNIACTGATTSTVVIGAAGGFDAGDTFVDVTLADGESVTCTFTNTLLGSLTIIKDVNPEPDATDFAFTGTGAGVSDFSLDDDADGTLSDTKTFSNLANGVLHTVTETTLPAYSLSNIACTGATTSTVVIGAAGGFDAGDTFVDVTLADGESVTCTFTNDLIPTFEGCTPGFWQGGLGVTLWNEVNDPDWTSNGGTGTNPFTTSTVFGTFFTPTGVAAIDNLTMLQIVGSGGTNSWPRKAARDLIAAYLNASFGLAYPYSTATILADWLTAVTTNTPASYQTFHLKYAAANQLGCPIGAPSLLL